MYAVCMFPNLTDVLLLVAAKACAPAVRTEAIVKIVINTAINAMAAAAFTVGLAFVLVFALAVDAAVV